MKSFFSLTIALSLVASAAVAQGNKAYSLLNPTIQSMVLQNSHVGFTNMNSPSSLGTNIIGLYWTNYLGTVVYVTNTTGHATATLNMFQDIPLWNVAAAVPPAGATSPSTNYNASIFVELDCVGTNALWLVWAPLVLLDGTYIEDTSTARSHLMSIELAASATNYRTNLPVPSHMLAKGYGGLRLRSASNVGTNNVTLRKVVFQGY